MKDVFESLIRRLGILALIMIVIVAIGAGMSKIDDMLHEKEPTLYILPNPGPDEIEEEELCPVNTGCTTVVPL